MATMVRHKKRQGVIKIPCHNNFRLFYLRKEMRKTRIFINPF